METLSDFPKVQCPFVRKIFPVNKDDFKKYGSQYQLRNPEVYLVTNEVSPGFEWVFDDPDTIAVEKLDGTNVKIKTLDGRLQALQNRKNVFDIVLVSVKRSLLSSLTSALLLLNNGNAANANLAVRH
tara:strand:- start:9905 stop:10285 length:381 start_codon:yes stop_codon:yes gene_type:complete